MDYILFLVLMVLVFFLRFNYQFFLNQSFWMSEKGNLDSLAYYFMLLSMLILLFVVVVSVGDSFLFYFLMIGLALVLLWFFMASTALFMFIFFESSFILMFMLIMVWGGNPERIEALKYFLIYSLVGSLPLLMAIVFIQENLSVMGLFTWVVGSLSSGSVSHKELSWDVVVSELEMPEYYFSSNGEEVVSFFFSSQMVFFFWVTVFLFKFPAFGVHLWLPKAHVESPVFGSMILAGMMMKLGVVGMMRFFSSGKLMYWDMKSVNSLFFYFCISLLAVGLMCSRQYDLKAFVAYSSVVHMSLILITMWSGSVMSMMGALFLSFAHGLCSSSLFLNLKSFYLLSSSRNMMLNSGYLYMSPLLCMFWFFLCSLKCSIPMSLKFFSELLLIISGVGFNWWSSLVYLLKMFFCGMYCILLYMYVSHGKSNFSLKFSLSFQSSYVVYLVLWYHFFMVYFYFFCFNSMNQIY